MFSDQVFELHKLIEVQRLLAEASNIPITEMYFGVGNMITDCDHDGYSFDSSDEQQKVVEALGEQAIVSKDVDRAPLLVAEATSDLGHDQPICPPNTAMCKNGVSAFSYPRFGVATQATEAAARSGASPYPPFTGDHTPGLVKGCSFTPPNSGGKGAKGGSLSFPYNFPAFPEDPYCTSSDPHSSDGSAVASACQQQSVVCGNHSSECKFSDQQSGAGTRHMIHFEHEGATASDGSINKEPVRSLYGMKTGCLVNSRYKTHEKEIKTGEKWLRVFGSNIENLQHASTMSNLNLTTVGYGQQHDNYYNQHSVDAFGMTQQDLAVERMECFNKEARGCKRQIGKELLDQHREVTRGLHGSTLSKPSTSPLNLFPLAPSLALNDHGSRSLAGGHELRKLSVKVMPQTAEAASDSAAGILFSIQQDRKN